MPRRSSAGRSSSRSAPVRNPPAPTSHAPPPAHPVQNGGSMLGGLVATIAEGMAFGTGTAMAHRAVEAVMGPRVIQHETVVSGSPATASTPTLSNANALESCNIHSKAFQDCLNSNGSDISKCEFYMDMLSECRKNAGAAISV